MKGASRCDDDNTGMATVASSAPSNDNCNFFTTIPLRLNLVLEHNSKDKAFRIHGDSEKYAGRADPALSRV